jgi:hypothetical protein
MMTSLLTPTYREIIGVRRDSRQRKVTTPMGRDLAAAAKSHNRALGCRCGNLRTVSAGYSRWPDTNSKPRRLGTPARLALHHDAQAPGMQRAAPAAYLRDHLYDGQPDDQYRDVLTGDRVDQNGVLHHQHRPVRRG